jgi:hypothetical protein
MKDHNLKKKHIPTVQKTPQDVVLGKVRELENQDQITKNLYQEMEGL